MSDLATMACSGGLQCTALLGPFTGSGYGYCAAAAPAPAPAAAAAATAPVPAPAQAAVALSTVPGPAPALAPVSTLSSLASLQVFNRSTTAGSSCSLPMVVHGLLLADCYSNGTASVCFPDGQTSQPCSQSSSAPATLLSLQQAGSLSTGSTGELCTLSAQAAGADVSCTPPLGCVAASTGLLQGSAYGYCSQLPTLLGAESYAALGAMAVQPRYTTSGAACDLPLGVNGTLLTDCSGGTCWVGGQQVRRPHSALPHSCALYTLRSSAHCSLSAAQLE